jgi:excisionase family DNA binding protein
MLTWCSATLSFPEPPHLFRQFRDSGKIEPKYTGGMIDDSCRSKHQTANCAGGAPNKQGIREDDSGAADERDGAPPPSQTSEREPTVAFEARKQNASRSLVRVGPIPSDFPAWALQQPNDPTPRKEITSPVVGQLRLGSPPVDPLITVGEAATSLHVSPRTIRRLIERGELHALRIGRSVRIRPEDVKHIILGEPND